MMSGLNQEIKGDTVPRCGELNPQGLKSFSGKRVFITGHTGFKGSWLTFLLHEVGADIMGFALPPEQGPSHFEMLNLQNKVNNIVGDIRNGSELSAALQSFQPEYVFHLAAQALVKKSH